MPSTKELSGIERIIQPVVWIIDSSASMEGERSITIERVFEEYRDVLKKSNASDIEIKTGVLTFNTDFRWLNEPELFSVDSETINEFHLTPGGMTNVGSVLHELNSKLSRAELFKGGRYKVPLLLFTLDGHSTDYYKSALDLLKRNKWFQRSMKMGLAIGSEVDIELLTEVVGDEALFTDPNLFIHTIKKLFAPYKYSDSNGCSDGVEHNLETIRPVIGKNIILPSFENPVNPDLIIEINQIEYEIHHREYKIVRCQIGACDLSVANQMCFVANVLPDNKSVLLKNVDLSTDNLYLMHFSLNRNKSIELEIDLLDGMITSGNIQIHINNNSFSVQSLSDNSNITINLSRDKQIMLKLGEYYEMETLTSKVSISVKDGWSWGDDWD